MRALAFVVATTQPHSRGHHGEEECRANLPSKFIEHSKEISEIRVENDKECNCHKYSFDVLLFFRCG